eukprot:3789161-Rhodomonas_salina.1
MSVFLSSFFFVGLTGTWCARESEASARDSHLSSTVSNCQMLPSTCFPAHVSARFEIKRKEKRKKKKRKGKKEKGKKERGRASSAVESHLSARASMASTYDFVAPYSRQYQSSRRKCVGAHDKSRWACVGAYPRSVPDVA